MARRMENGGKKRMRSGAGMAALAVGASLLGGCAEFRENTSASILNSVTGTALGPKPAQTADFVIRSRREQAAGFMDVGVTPPKRSIGPKTPAEVAATQLQLTGTAQQQQQTGAAIQQEGARVLQTAPKAPVVQ